MKILFSLFSLLILCVSNFALDDIKINKINDHIKLHYKSNTYLKTFPIDIYLTADHKLSHLKSSFQYAQDKLEKCRVKLVVNSIFNVNASEHFSLWETFTFNNFKITEWEKSFFKKARKGNKVLFLDSLNWTYEGQGTWGFGYAPFIESYFSKENTQYLKLFKEKMLGTAIIGHFRAKWTVVHEIAHAVFNIDHSYQQNNIMNPGKLWQDAEFDQDSILITDKIPNYDPEFSSRQCETILKTNQLIN